MSTQPLVLVVLGTRPEAIKLAPVIRALAAEPSLRVCVARTGQHRELVDQVLDVFDLRPDHDLATMTTNQTLPDLTSRLVVALDRLIARAAPQTVLVQGDTTTAFAAALAAFYHRVPVGHVEAGLRTGNRYAPFPEEINRRLISVLSTWHFAPTTRNEAALLAEGIAAADVRVTGNTVIDALQLILQTTCSPLDELPGPGRRLLLVTAHRRESFGAPFAALCRAIRRIADTHPALDICYPVHLNPNVRQPVAQALAGHPRIHLLEPLDYVSFVHLLARADLVLTDSGGVQEEAPALGKPVLVMREVTERPEAIEAGIVELVGTDEERIVRRVNALLNDAAAYAARARPVSPYGDGRASARIVAFLRTRLLGNAPQHDH